jgi:CheY-like chemotaxis protein/HPt (histidine-containing phosphotransfer) domain-containing protein
MNKSSNSTPQRVDDEEEDELPMNPDNEKLQNERRNMERHVLIVDDDNVSRNILSKMLENLQYKITTAGGGREALQLLSKDDTFTLLLVDIFMPDIDGIELLRIFKRAYSKDIPIIMVSSTEDPETIAKCFQSGAADFLQKPINFEMLKKRVEVCETLRREREKRNRLAEQIKRKEKELQEIKSQITTAIETPMQVVVKECADLLEGTHSAEQYKGALIAILRSLGSRDLYKPAFSDVMEKEGMDNTTVAWLQSELLNETKTTKPTPQAPRYARTGEKQLLDQKVTNLQDEFAPKIIEKPISNLLSFSFNVFDHTQEELIDNVAYMFKNLNLIEEFNISTTKLFNFIRTVREAYHNNPYHNFWHALDTIQFVYACLNVEKVNSFFSRLDMLAMLIAAICHDLDHPGLNNNFQINARTSLAILYNDISVLENHHSSLAFTILNRPECNAVENLQSDEYKEFRRNVISNILATDMAHHFEIISKFQTRLQTGSLSKENKDDKTQLMNIIIKCADVSNAVRPFYIAKIWADKVTEEFLKQGDKEREMDLPISPLMDRRTVDEVQLQINFITYLVEPLFSAFVQYIPAVSHLLSSMQTNRASWMNLQIQPEKPTPEPTQSETEEERISVLTGKLDEEVLAKTRGFSVLIIEDHTPSRNSMISLLFRNGYEATCISNIDEAIKTINLDKSKSFDAVVIDLSTVEGLDLPAFRNKMKRLQNSFDHYTAILGLEDPHPGRVSKYYEGISILLTKPVSAKDFILNIERCIDITMDYAKPVNLKKAIDQSGADENFTRELLDDLVVDGLKKLDDIKKYIKNLDWSNLRLQAHSLKGAAAQLACKPLAQAAFFMERGAKMEDTSVLKEAVIRLERRLKELQRFIQSIRLQKE